MNAKEAWLVFDDGTFVKSPRADFQAVSAQRITVWGIPYILASFKASNQDSTVLFAELGDRSLVLDSVFRAGTHLLSHTLTETTLSIQDIAVPVNMVQLVPVPTVHYKDQTYYFYVRDGRTILQRESDLKVLDLGKDDFTLEKDSYFEQNGILSFKDRFERVDLDQFDAEVKRVQGRLIAGTVVHSSEGTVDTITEVLKKYPDLVQDSLNSPLNFTERMDENIKNMLARNVRNRKSSVLLGNAGTGKTSAIRAFAREVGLGHIMGVPRTVRILEVRPSKMASGTKWTGSIEQRIEELVDVSRRTGWVLFIDEIHSLAGTGTSSSQKNDVTQYLKGPLAQKEMIVIATDTKHEYDHAFNGDPAFDGRLERVSVSAPTGEDLITIAHRAIASNSWKIPATEVIQAAIEYSEKFDVVCEQPRAMVNLLTSAYGWMEDQGRLDQPLLIDDLKLATVQKYGLKSDLFNLTMTQHKVQTLRARLDAEIIGQEDAKQAIVNQWEMALSGLQGLGVNSLLLLGPPGVGKTRLAEASADLMGYQKTVIAMHEFKTDREAILNEIYRALLENPFQVIILDRFDQAPAVIQESILELLEKGKIRNGASRTKNIEFKHSILIITANAGQDFIDKEYDNQVSPKELKANISSEEISALVLRAIPVVSVMQRLSKEEFKKGVITMMNQILTEKTQKTGLQFILKEQSAVIQQICESQLINSSDYYDLNAVGLEIRQAMAHAITHALKTQNNLAPIVLEVLPKRYRKPSPPAFYG